MAQLTMNKLTLGITVTLLAVITVQLLWVLTVTTGHDCVGGGKLRDSLAPYSQRDHYTLALNGQALGHFYPELGDFWLQQEEGEYVLALNEKPVSRFHQGGDVVLKLVTAMASVTQPEERLYLPVGGWQWKSVFFDRNRS